MSQVDHCNNQSDFISTYDLQLLDHHVQDGSEESSICVGKYPVFSVHPSERCHRNPRELLECSPSERGHCVKRYLESEFCCDQKCKSDAGESIDSGLA